MARGVLQLAGLFKDEIGQATAVPEERLKLAPLLNDSTLGQDPKDAVTEPETLSPGTGQKEYSLAGKPFLKKVVGTILCLSVVAALIVAVPEVWTDVRNRLAALLQGFPISTGEQGKQPAKRQNQPSVDITAFSKPVQELMEYVQCLAKNGCDFKPKITGEEAAKQFGYSRLFASTYDEVVIRAKTRQRNQEVPRGGDVIADFESIVLEEQLIDRLLGRKERHAAAIAYLRALQNGDAIFPGPQATAPIPNVLLAQLASVYPDVNLDIDDSVFAVAYREVREFAMDRMISAGEVSAHEIIAELRRLIIKSATSKITNTVPSICEKGEVVGVLVALSRMCPRLRLSQPAIKLSEEVAQQKLGIECQTKAATNLQSRLEAMSSSDLTGICDRAGVRIQTNKTEFFEFAN